MQDKMEKNSMCPVGTKIQSLIIDKEFFDEKEAKEWAKSHDFKYGKLDVKEKSYRFRQLNPSFIRKGTFRTIELTDGVQAVIGCPIPEFENGGDIDSKFDELIGGSDVVVNNTCIKQSIWILQDTFPIKDWFILSDDSKLVIIFKKELTDKEINDVKSILSQFTECHYLLSVGNLQKNDNGKSVSIELKHDNVSVGEFADGGGVDEVDYSGNYQDLTSFIENNGLQKKFANKYKVSVDDWEDYTRGHLGTDEEVIKELMGKEYNIFYNEDDDEFIVTKKKTNKLDYKIILSDKKYNNKVINVIDESGVYSEYKPRFVVIVGNKVIGGSTYEIDEDNVYHFDLGILKEYQGYGISKELIDKILLDAQSLGAVEVNAYVVNDMLFQYLKILKFNVSIDDGQKYAWKTIRKKKKLSDGGGVGEDLEKLLPKEKILKLLKETKFKSFDSSEIENNIEYETKTYNPFDKNFALRISAYPCLIIIDKIDSVYEVRIAKNSGWIGGISFGGWDYVFEIPKINYQEFENGLKKAVADKNIVLYSKWNSGGVRDFYFMGSIGEARKFAEKNGYEEKLSLNKIYFYNPSMPNWKDEKVLKVGTFTQRQIEKGGSQSSGGIKKLEEYSNGGGIESDAKDNITINTISGIHPIWKIVDWIISDLDIKVVDYIKTEKEKSLPKLRLYVYNRAKYAHDAEDIHIDYITNKIYEKIIGNEFSNYEESLNKMIKKLEEEITSYEELKNKLTNNLIKPYKIIGRGIKPQYARKLAFESIDESLSKYKADLIYKKSLLSSLKEGKNIILYYINGKGVIKENEWDNHIQVEYISGTTEAYSKKRLSEIKALNTPVNEDSAQVIGLPDAIGDDMYSNFFKTKEMDASFGDELVSYWNKKKADFEDEYVSKLRAVGFSDKDIFGILFGYISIYDLKCDREFSFNGILKQIKEVQMESIDEIIESKNSGYYEAGLKYPITEKHLIDELFDKYKINETPLVFDLMEGVGKSKMYIYKGDGIYLGKAVNEAYGEKKPLDKYDSVNKGYMGIVTDSIKKLYDSINILFREEDCYIKDLNVFYNNLGGIDTKDIEDTFGKPEVKAVKEVVVPIETKKEVQEDSSKYEAKFKVGEYVSIEEEPKYNLENAYEVVGHENYNKEYGWETIMENFYTGKIITMYENLLKKIDRPSLSKSKEVIVPEVVNTATVVDLVKDEIQSIKDAIDYLQAEADSGDEEAKDALDYLQDELKSISGDTKKVIETYADLNNPENITGFVFKPTGDMIAPSTNQGFNVNYENGKIVSIELWSGKVGMKKDMVRKWNRDVIDSISKGYGEELIEEFEKGGETLIGGKADYMSLDEIADMHGVTLDHILRQSKIGAKVEREHTSDDNKIVEIVKDHLYESPDYYTKLQQIESSFESKGSGTYHWLDVPNEYKYKFMSLSSLNGLSKYAIDNNGSSRFLSNNERDIDNAISILNIVKNPNFNSAILNINSSIANSTETKKDVGNKNISSDLEEKQKRILKPEDFNNKLEYNLDTESVSCFIHSKSTGRTLVMRRAGGSDFNGTWALVSGGVELGESNEETIKREIQEEMGIDLNCDGLIFMDAVKHPDRTHYYYELSVDDEFEPIMNHENDAYMWINMAELPKNTHPLLLKFIKMKVFA